MIRFLILIDSLIIFILLRKLYSDIIKMMRCKYYLILIVFALTLNSCRHYHAADKIVTFKTPFGYIHRGDSMGEVVSVLGNPHEVSNYKRREVWSYDFNKNGQVLVNFVKGSVREVRVEEDIEQE